MNSLRSSRVKQKKSSNSPEASFRNGLQLESVKTLAWGRGSEVTLCWYLVLYLRISIYSQCDMTQASTNLGGKTVKAARTHTFSLRGSKHTTGTQYESDGSRFCQAVASLSEIFWQLIDQLNNFSRAFLGFKLLKYEGYRVNLEAGIPGRL